MKAITKQIILKKRKIVNKYYSDYCTINNKLDLNFHKEKSVNSGCNLIDNIFSSKLDDSNYSTPEPKFYPKGIFADEYLKQVIAVVMNSGLKENTEIMKEAKEQAETYLKIKGFNVGAYSDSKGLLTVRKNLATWYAERDEGHKINEDEIYLTNGGMNSYDHILSLICENNDTVILPSPCYPLYDRYNKANGVNSLHYTFNGIEEGLPTTINFTKLRESIEASRAKGNKIKAMLVINPGAPLGNVMSLTEMEYLVRFCEENRLVLIAVESLQNSLHPRVVKGEVESFQSVMTRGDAKVTDSEGKSIQKSEKDSRFKSFRFVVNKLQSKLELFSIFSISKGPFYNQNIRAGILDYMNLDEEVAKQLYKYKSIDLCSGVPGQIFIDLTLNKPKQFGYEFLFNFEQSINSFKRSLYEAKVSLQSEVSKSGDFIMREVEAGHIVYLKSSKGKTQLKVNGKFCKSTPGEVYGVGLSDYTGFYLPL